MQLTRGWGLLVVAVLTVLTSCGGPAQTTTVKVNTSAEKAACNGTLPPASPQRTFTQPPPMGISSKQHYTAIIETEYGVIDIKLLPKIAPRAVNNFVFLACHSFYNGLTFHRVVPGFVIQGGDPQGNGAGGPGYEFADELPSSAAVYTLGAVAMANAGPNTNGSQFFICIANDTKQLQPLYTYFGQVTSGFRTLKRIAQVKRTTGSDGQQSQPVTPVVMKRVVVEEQ
ncbi:MAG: peptidylprolyl isomerase [Chloroflexi bacterium]|nr:peptidylprolyl isomerase [Chloroflexota bacterium]MCL5946419.1 peptidylprolyl isomerase [Chloroflexota bacterium]